MAGWKIEKFLGLRPRFDDRLLEANQAVAANNLRLGSGNLRALRGQTTVQAFAKAGTITSFFPMDVGDPATRYWLHWVEDVDVTRSPVRDDANDRHYYTGAADKAPETGNKPKMTFDSLVDDPSDGAGAGEYPRNWRYLGIPEPGTVVTAPTAPTLATELIINSTNVTTFSSPNVDLSFDSPYFQDRNNYSDFLSYDGVPGGQNIKAGFEVGQEFRVTKFDNDTIILNGLDRVYTTLTPLDNNKWFAEQTTTSAKQFLNGRVRHKQFTISFAADHGFRTGDILRVRAVTTDPTGGQTTTFNNVSGTQIATTTTDIQFHSGTGADLGSVELDVIRDESEIGNAVVDRSYIYTFVSDLGEEGPPSDPSGLITTLESDDIVLGNFDIPPTDHRNIVEIRVYRTNVSDATADFQYAGNITDAGAIAAGTASFTDTLLSFELGEVIQSQTYFPPDENMKGLISLPNGVLAGFFGKTVAFSEPYLPHAWPPEYELQTDYDIVGLGVYGNSVLVCTTGTPYVASGAHPRQMNLRRIEVNQACVSKRSIANIGEIVLYATPDGLAAAGSDGFRIISEDFYGRDEWQALVPTTMDGEVHDGKYVAFFNDGVARGLQFDPTRLEVGLTYMDDWGWGMYVDLETDTLYMTDGNNLLSWDTDSAALQTLTWRSVELRTSAPTNYGWGRVQAKTYPLTFRLYADGVLKQERTVECEEPFRLPSGFLSSRWKVEVEGTSEVQTVYIGETAEDVLDE